MPSQDLTPELRTRLSRVERVAGLFVGLAVLLALAGAGYYLHHLADQRGWFLTKVRYFTYLDTATGLRIGDPVKLMGFTAGEITQITGEAPGRGVNVYIEFVIRAPYFGYIWTPVSKVKVAATDFLGNRSLEITKGDGTSATNVHASYREESRAGKPVVTGIWNPKSGRYDPLTKDSPPFYLQADETAAVTERLSLLAAQAESALPSFLSLTNVIQLALGNTAITISNANHLVGSLREVSTNLNDISAQLKDPEGSLGRWLLTSQVQTQVSDLLRSADTTIQHTDTQILTLATNLNESLTQLAAISASLRSQVERSTNVLPEISRAVTNADDLIQGLKRHWLLRGAFKKTNAPSERFPSRRK